MAKALKPQPGQLPQCPISAYELASNKPSIIESYILNSRLGIELRLKNFEQVRMMILKNISPIFSNPNPLELETESGIRISWADIDELVSDIISKYNTTGDSESVAPKNEIAMKIGFDNYDDLALVIEKGKESDDRNDRS